MHSREWVPFFYIYTLHNTLSPTLLLPVITRGFRLYFFHPVSWFIAFQVGATVVIQIEKKVFFERVKLKHIFVFLALFCWRKRWKKRSSHSHISSHASHLTHEAQKFFHVLFNLPGESFQSSSSSFLHFCSLCY